MSSYDSETSNSSLELQTPKGKESSKDLKMGDDVFETSDYQVDENMELDNERSSVNTISSMQSLQEDEEAWKKLPEGSKELCNATAGILYIDRYISFINGQWPYKLKSVNLCHPRALALAGLEFHSLEPQPSARCVVCLKVLENLTEKSSPWVLHSEISPHCFFVQLGQRGNVDDYSIDEFMEMIYRKIYNEAVQTLTEKEANVKKQLFQLKKRELDSEKS